MRIVHLTHWVLAILAFNFVGDPLLQGPQGTKETRTSPLILEKNEGERRIIRGWPGHPEPGETFILKVDPKNGGSSHLVLLTAELAPGKEIEAHKHPEADEIIILQAGTARVHLGDTVRTVHAGATVFIPANTWVSVDNVGNDPISFVGIFSAAGFEELMRDASVREGEKNIPMSKAEDDALQKKHLHSVIYKAP